MNDVAVKVADLPETYPEITVRGLDFSPDGSRVAVRSDGEKINIWNWRNKRVNKTVELPQGGYDGTATTPLLFSMDGRVLAACEAFGAGQVVVRFWDTTNWSILKDVVAATGIESRGGCAAMGFTPDGKLFIRTSDSGPTSGNHIVVYEVGTWLPIWGLHLDEFSPISLSINPDGDMVAVAGRVRVVPYEIADVSERIQKTRFDSMIYIINLPARKLMTAIRSDAMGPMAWSPDGARIAIAGAGGSVKIIDAKSSAILVEADVLRAAHMNIRFTPDGRYLVESDMNGRGTGLGVKIWDSKRGKLLQEISGNIGNIAISRDSKYLAVGGSGRTTIWQFK